MSVGVSMAIAQAPSIGGQQGDIRRHFRREHDAGQRRAHDAGEQGRHSDHREPFRLNMQVRECELTGQSEEQSELRAEHQQGANNPPGVPAE